MDSSTSLSRILQEESPLSTTPSVTLRYYRYAQLWAHLWTRDLDMYAGIYEKKDSSIA